MVMIYNLIKYYKLCIKNLKNLIVKKGTTYKKIVRLIYS